MLQFIEITTIFLHLSTVCDEWAKCVRESKPGTPRYKMAATAQLSGFIARLKRIHGDKKSILLETITSRGIDKVSRPGFISEDIPSSHLLSFELIGDKYRAVRVPKTKWARHRLAAAGVVAPLCSNCDCEIQDHQRIPGIEIVYGATYTGTAWLLHCGAIYSECSECLHHPRGEYKIQLCPDCFDAFVTSSADLSSVTVHGVIFQTSPDSMRAWLPGGKS